MIEFLIIMSIAVLLIAGLKLVFSSVITKPVAPKDESKEDQIDRLISTLEGVCDELEDMR